MSGWFKQWYSFPVPLIGTRVCLEQKLSSLMPSRIPGAHINFKFEGRRSELIAPAPIVRAPMALAKM
jgi:hypothetical protein